MEFIIIIAIIISINFSIGNYFSMKGIEAVKEFDYERDKEIIREIGIKDFSNIDSEISEKIEEKRIRFMVFTITSIILSAAYLIMIVFYETNYRQALIGMSIIGAWSILEFLDKWLNLRELKKMKYINYKEAVVEENKRLAPIRLFFMISSIILIIIVIMIQETNNLKSINKNYYNISFSVILIYLGGMGLVSKIMFLKVPLKLDGKLQPYINSIILGFGLYLLVSSLINIFF